MVKRDVEIGTQAPNVALQDEQGQPVQISDLWTGTERGVVLAFLRHYG